MRKLFFLLIIVPFLITSCSKESDFQRQKKTQIVFLSKINGNTIDGREIISDQWQNGDQIGVYIEGCNEHRNVLYYTNGSGYFKSDNSIFYPEKECQLNFIAYHPFKTDLKDDIYPIDLTKEQPDLLYSSNLKNAGFANMDYKNQLEFNHVLARVYLSVVSSTEVNSLDGLSAKLQGLTKATFSINSGQLSIDDNSRGEVPLAISGDNSEKIITGVVIPASPNTVSLYITIGTQTYEWVIPNTLKGGYIYGYKVKLNENSIEVSTSLEPQIAGTVYTLYPIYLENPTEPTPPVTEPSVPDLKSYMEIPLFASGGTAPNGYQATHMVTNRTWLNNSTSTGEIRNYTVHFNIKDRYPEWIAYPLHPIYMTSGNRTDDWQYDPLIPQQYQPNLFSGWQSRALSRGHMLPSASRSATKALNRTTFYFTNMAAQESQMNSSTWNDLEEKVRYWSKQTSTYDTLYVVTGAILPASPEPVSYATDASGNKAAIPKYLYKALLRKNKSSGAYYSIAFKMENRNSGVNYIRSVVSVEQIEKETGFTFFPKLPENMSADVKKQTNLANWN
ncbi:MAG: DNA/RNA non-specific endonuclease [Bacteroidia bacterium]|nr:DNA/RNA non-specific endonuclease [Bacteroidia bacterium]